MLHRHSIRQFALLGDKEDTAAEKLCHAVFVLSPLMMTPMSLWLAQSMKRHGIEWLSDIEKSITINQKEAVTSTVGSPNKNLVMAGQTDNPFETEKRHYFKDTRLRGRLQTHHSASERKQIMSAVAASEKSKQPAYETTDILKPKLDKSNYRYLVLSNGLRVMLVSDKNCPRAACCLCLPVGHVHNPRHIPGLAVYFMKMLLLNSEKYPETLREFFCQHGGSVRGLVDDAWMALNFDVSPEHLDQGLDRCAAAVNEPLFGRHYLSRALSALKFTSVPVCYTDIWKYGIVLRRLANPNHCFQNLSALRSASLVDGREFRTIRNELARFHERYFSANLITLCVIGKEPLDKLEQMVKNGRFERIRSEDTLIPYDSVNTFVNGPVYRPEDLGKMVR